MLKNRLAGFTVNANELIFQLFFLFFLLRYYFSKMLPLLELEKLWIVDLSYEEGLVITAHNFKTKKGIFADKFGFCIDAHKNLNSKII